MDRAISDDPAIQAQLDRLSRLSPGRDILGLERIERLLDRLGRPETRLPPVFHVAGTNGKGSTCAFLRASIEAAGLRAHVYSSPHLVRFNERIRVAGRLIEDAALADLLVETLDAAEGLEISFFEATTATAFLAFSRAEAEACILEVGLGGRLDATNVIRDPICCGIAQLGLDHAAFLGDRLEQVAAEKAGIAKPGVPLVTQLYPAELNDPIERAANAVGATWLPCGGVWDFEGDEEGVRYRDRAGTIHLPPPRLAGAHQSANAALALAMLRHQRMLVIGEHALQEAPRRAEWPARLQELPSGAIRDLLPRTASLWLDGAHNPAAAAAAADFFRKALAGQRFHIVFGLLANKDLPNILRPFQDLAPHIHAVPVPAHDHHDPADIVAAAETLGLKASASTDVTQAIRRIARTDPDRPPVVLILGSLYLAGDVLRLNGPIPD